MKVNRNLSAVMAAMVLTSVTCGAGATEISQFSDTPKELLGLTMGYPQQTEPAVKHIADNLVIHVQGKSLTDEGKSKNVTGIYNGFGSQLTVDKDLKVVLKNDAPASKRELGHYYMNAVYAGYGGVVKRFGDTDYGDTVIHVKGNVDIDAVGSGLQVNKQGNIIVEGGGKVITHPVVTADTYSAVAEEGNIYVNSGLDGKHPGAKNLTLYGNVGLIDKDYGRDPNPNEAPTNIGLALTTPNSSLTGAVLNEYAESNKNPHNSGADIYLQNGAVWKNEWIGAERPTPKKERKSNDNASYLYKGSKVRNLVGGPDVARAGVIHPVDGRPISIQNYSGYTTASYQDGTEAAAAGKGAIVIEHAADHSHITLQGDSNKDLKDDASYRQELKTLGEKLHYANSGDRKLSASVEIKEGITRPKASIELGADNFDSDGKLVISDAAPVKHAGESTFVSGSKAALASTAMSWRNNTNNLQRRLGDLRFAKAGQGVWGKYIGGKSSMSDGADVHMTYNGVEVGYDHRLSSGWILGGALDYNDSNTSYTAGSGDGKLAGLAVYGTKQNDDGSYLDVIARGSRLSNDYALNNLSGNRLSGNYHTYGTSLSAEYGKRIKKTNGLYLDPSLELVLGRLNSVSYNAAVASGGSMHVKADALNSAVGRLGIGVGKETNKSNFFAKLALAHEFSGKLKASYSALGNPTVNTELDLKDTWLDAEVGGTWNYSPNTYFYGTLTKNFGATIDNKWRVDAGFRHNF